MTIAEVTTAADMRPFVAKAKELHDHGRENPKGIDAQGKIDDPGLLDKWGF